MADMIKPVPLVPAIPNNTKINIPMESYHVENAKKNFQVQSIIYMLSVIIGGGLLTYYISGKSLKPIKNLSSQIKNITTHNLSKKIDVPNAKDEIAELTTSFNEMTDKLSNAFTSQKQFSANAAHELRTPLAVLQTKVDVFKKKKDHTTVEYDSLIDVLETHTHRLSDIVKNLLDMTNMQEIELNESINLYSLLEDILYDLEDIAIKKHVTLDLSDDNAFVYGNYNLLHRAFYNLVENSIKYNRKNGNVSVNIKSTKNDVTVVVCDTGIGIPSEMQSQIFNPFFKVDKSRSREMGGVGLGLSIVKNIIENHGGSIIVKDNKPRGTCFVVTLKNIK
ncbi:HAMP domain-containing sensor histidine kinase [Oceanirhabdus seepicola]|nr:HAMP domain-containing sensor histidine kinase [Oceanirhabdus seepicola]